MRDTLDSLLQIFHCLSLTDKQWLIRKLLPSERAQLQAVLHRQDNPKPCPFNAQMHPLVIAICITDPDNGIKEDDLLGLDISTREAIARYLEADVPFIKSWVKEALQQQAFDAQYNQ